MGFTPEQIKGRIKSVAKQNNADARTLMRIYTIRHFNRLIALHKTEAVISNQADISRLL